MRYSVKKFVLFISMLTLLLIACDKNNGEDNIEPPVDTEKYTFIDLKYNFLDKEEAIFEKLLKIIEYNNPTNAEQTLPIGDVSSVKNFMFFQSNDEITDYFFNDSILVNIPEYIDNERIYLTKEKYLFSLDNVNLPIDNLPNDTLTIAANSTVNIHINVVFKEYTVGFELSYWDNILNKPKTVNGKWKMVRFIKLQNEYI
ncbi:MAG: hypothetical protein ACRC13_02855 [Tannerellaceae bacterium]